MTTSSHHNVSKVMIALMVGLVGVGQIFSDLYVPALPAISAHFHATYNYAEYTLTAYMLGFSLGQFFFGPLSDRWGRRPIIFMALLVAVLGCAIPVLSPSSMRTIVLARLLQGWGMAGCLCIGRSIIRDVSHHPSVASHIASLCATFNVFFISASPALGGFLTSHFGWKSNFDVMLIATALLLLFGWCFLKETLSLSSHQAPQAWYAPWQGLIQALTNHNFLLYTLVSGAAYGMLIACVTHGPQLYINVLHLTPHHYGSLIGFLGLAGFGSQWINRWMGHHIAPHQRLLYCSVASWGTSLLYIVLGQLHPVTVMGLYLPNVLLLLSCVIVFINAFALAMHALPNQFGAGAAVYGCGQVLGGVVSSALVSTLHTWLTSTPIGLVNAFLSLLMSLALFGLRPSNQDG